MDEQIMAANSVEQTEGIATPVEATEQVSAENVQTEAVQQTTETVKPDITETQAFSRRLNEEKQKAIDAEYSRLYGQEYGIHSKADYEKAIADQKAAEERARIQEQTGIDPDNLKPIFEQWKQSDPDFQELSKIRAENNTKAALSDLNNELKNAGLDLQLNDLSDAELLKIPNIDKVTEQVQKGHSLADAYFLANKNEIINQRAAKAEQETIKKITANGASSPGSLATGGEGESKTIYGMAKTDFKKLQEEVLRGERKKL